MFDLRVTDSNIKRELKKNFDKVLNHGKFFLALN